MFDSPKNKKATTKSEEVIGEKQDR
jgi:hypothetical protein